MENLGNSSNRHKAIIKSEKTLEEFGSLKEKYVKEKFFLRISKKKDGNMDKKALYYKYSFHLLFIIV
jgi:hypothetical protein